MAIKAKLNRIIALYEAGVLTKDEMDAAKRKLLPV